MRNQNLQEIHYPSTKKEKNFINAVQLLHQKQPLAAWATWKHKKCTEMSQTKCVNVERSDTGNTMFLTKNTSFKHNVNCSRNPSPQVSTFSSRNTKIRNLKLQKLSTVKQHCSYTTKLRRRKGNEYQPVDTPCCNKGEGTQNFILFGPKSFNWWIEK